MRKILPFKQVVLCCCLIGLGACQTSEPTPYLLPTEQIMVIETPPEIIPATPELDSDQVEASPTQPSPNDADPTSATRYAFDVILNYAAHTLEITQTINYTNNTGEVLSELPLLVPPAYHKDTFDLQSVEIDPVITNAAVQIQAGEIWIQLNQDLEPGALITLILTYHLHPPKGSGAFGYTRRQMLLADWYAYIPLFQEDHGWLINTPGVVGEYLAYPLSDFNVNLHLSPADEKLVVAASAPLAEKEAQRYQYSAEGVRNFSLAISPHYHTTMVRGDLATVYVYNFPKNAGMGKRTAQLAYLAWETYSERYGPNPRQFLSIVEAEIDDGLECDGLFYLSNWYFNTADDTLKNYYALLVVHEVSHQWFYGLIHNDQANEPWLDEALATYSELLFLETHHPELVNWWWHFRVHSFNPTGYVNASIYEFNAYQPYINAVYLRGAAFLQTIRDSMGDKPFFEFLMDYTQSGEEDFLRDSDFFFHTLDQATDVDLSAIISKYHR
jgi:hypothetical protein